MSLVAQCSACSQQFQADPAYAGQTHACPSCGGVVLVPQAVQQTPAGQSPFAQQGQQYGQQGHRGQQAFQQQAAYQQPGTQQSWQTPAQAMSPGSSQPVGEQTGGQVFMERAGWACSSIGVLSLVYPLFGLQVRRLARLEEMVGGAMPFISLVFGLVGAGLLFGGSMYHMKRAWILSGSFAGALLLGFVLNLVMVDRGGVAADDGAGQSVAGNFPGSGELQDSLDQMDDLNNQVMEGSGGLPGAPGGFPGTQPNVGSNVPGNGSGIPGRNPLGNQNNANSRTVQLGDPADSQPFRRPIPTGRKSGLVGSVGGGEYVELATEGKRFMGVSGSDGSWAGKMRLARFQPYLFPGPAPRGKYTDRAKNGYAVGAIEVNYDGYVNAVRCTYVKINGSEPDWSDTYQGEWIGDPSGNQVKQYGGEDEPPIIGVYYRQGLVLNALGVLYAE